MANIKVSELFNLLRENYSIEELGKMSDEEIDREACEIQDEINIGKMEVKQDELVYGDTQHEEYLLSERYEADCKSEQWDWLKMKYE